MRFGNLFFDRRVPNSESFSLESPDSVCKGEGKEATRQRNLGNELTSRIDRLHNAVKRIVADVVL